jgi:hypothetical protein
VPRSPSEPASSSRSQRQRRALSPSVALIRVPRSLPWP